MFDTFFTSKEAAKLVENNPDIFIEENKYTRHFTQDKVVIWSHETVSDGSDYNRTHTRITVYTPDYVQGTLTHGYIELLKSWGIPDRQAVLKHVGITFYADKNELIRSHRGRFFSPENMRFFNSRLSSKIHNGRYFVTSEKDPFGSPRGYTIRYLENGSVEEVGGFDRFDSMEAAHRIASQLL